MNFLNLRKEQNTHHPKFCTCDVNHRSVGVVRGFRGLMYIQHVKVESNPNIQSPTLTEHLQCVVKLDWKTLLGLHSKLKSLVANL